MENYIFINGRKIALTAEQVKAFLDGIEPNEVQLADISVGDTFQIGDYEFVVLDQTGDTTKVILKELLPSQKFGESNNFVGSAVSQTCYAFIAGLASVVGSENIIEFEVDLTSDDGLKDYGTINSRCTLLTADQYRSYVDILDKFNPGARWWLATPFSTKRHGDTYGVKCVSPSGYVYYNDFNFDDIGVRPFCILKSTIFVSK